MFAKAFQISVQCWSLHYTTYAEPKQSLRDIFDDSSSLACCGGPHLVDCEEHDSGRRTVFAQVETRSAGDFSCENFLVRTTISFMF
jgi:hypothetical protein